jgi:hypothetical protein
MMKRKDREKKHRLYTVKKRDEIYNNYLKILYQLLKILYL